MQLITNLTIVCLLGTALAVGSHVSAQEPPLRARAIIQGAPGSGVSGEAILIQSGTGILPTVLIIVRVEGLAPGSVHGIHIHETGRCEPTFALFSSL